MFLFQKVRVMFNLNILLFLLREGSEQHIDSFSRPPSTRKKLKMKKPHIGD